MAHYFYPTRLKLVWQSYLAILSSVIGAQESGISADPSTGLYQYPDCEYVESKWNDGDSFSVRLADGQSITVRLYEVDTIETHINNSTAARRLRAQRRYFGISAFGATAEESIQKAIELGELATAFTQNALAGKPFTIYTSHADARGGVNNKRIYAFIETSEGKSLAGELVQSGLARAYGVYRQSPKGLDQDEARERFKDMELRAAGSRRGIWAFTDWEALPDERLIERLEEIELYSAVQQSKRLPLNGSLNPNTANKEQLETIPGIGPSTAQKIIDARLGQPFDTLNDLLKISGIGQRTLEKMQPYLVFE
jgi:competence protein ComEA